MESLNRNIEIENDEIMMLQLDEREEFGWWCTANACFGKIGLCLAVACFPFLGI